MARRYSYFPLSSTYQGASRCPLKGRSPLTGIRPPRLPAPEYLWAKRPLYAQKDAESIKTLGIAFFRLCQTKTGERENRSKQAAFFVEQSPLDALEMQAILDERLVSL
jgi:hypothetical protein